MIFLKNRFSAFLKNDLEWSSSVANLIMCLCMAYFYYDSALYAPLFYSIFFFAYILIVFLFGEKIIPFLYLIYILGAVQDLTFINCTGFFICIFLGLYFPKSKKILYAVYAVEIFSVCFRRQETVLHLLCHFAFCFVFLLFAMFIKRKVEKDTVQKEKNRIREEVEAEISEKVREELRSELRKNLKPLELTDGEEAVLKQFADGKLLKEIDCVSKNTKTDYIKSAMAKNNCRTKNEIVAMYSIRQRLPELFPSLFPA